MANYPVVQQPENYSRMLFDHQKTSIHEMEKLEKKQTRTFVTSGGNYLLKTKIGIQSDPTGFGKTSSMVGLVVRNKMAWNYNTEWTNEDTYISNPALSVSRISSHPRINTTLVIASQSLVSQWREEFALTLLTCDVVRTRKKAKNINVADFEVIICTPTMYNLLVRRFPCNVWKRLIYDEPGTTQIPSMSPILTGFTWFVTATPEVLRWRYNTRRSHHISRMGLQYVESAFYKAIQIQNPIEYVKSSYEMPAVINLFYDCFQPLSGAIRGFVSDRIQTMIEAGNVRGAIQQLGGRESSDLLETVRKRYEEDLERANDLIVLHTRRNNTTLIETWTQKKESIQKQIDEMEERFNKESLKAMCNICFSTPMKKPALLDCNGKHIYCGECIVKWLSRSNTCPLCRSSVTLKDLTCLTMVTDNVEDKKKITKTQQIVKIINKKKNGRFIIFSEEDATYSLINKELIKAGISCKEIKGRSETREKTIKCFKNGDVKVIFLNSRNNGAGINLQECTDIILFHAMNHSIETQILGRANRIGRKVELYVHRLRPLT
jgi:SNF2 family DNA or RNA helicase